MQIISPEAMEQAQRFQHCDFGTMPNHLVKICITEECIKLGISPSEILVVIKHVIK